MILFDWMEWDGPVQESWPTPAYQRIFFGGEKATKDIAYAREILTRFAARAYRRPVRPAEVERLLKLVEVTQKSGEGFESSVKTAMLAVLCSKSFLYLVEGSPDAPSPRSPTGNWLRVSPIFFGAQCPTSGSSISRARASCTSRTSCARKCAA